VTQGKQVD